MKAFIVDFTIAFRVIANSREEAHQKGMNLLPQEVIDHVSCPCVEEDTQNPYDPETDEDKEVNNEPREQPTHYLFQDPTGHRPGGTTLRASYIRESWDLEEVDGDDMSLLYFLDKCESGTVWQTNHKRLTAL